LFCDESQGNHVLGHGGTAAFTTAALIRRAFVRKMHAEPLIVQIVPTGVVPKNGSAANRDLEPRQGAGAH
jgi:hypothetical protein